MQRPRAGKAGSAGRAGTPGRDAAERRPGSLRTAPAAATCWAKYALLQVHKLLGHFKTLFRVVERGLAHEQIEQELTHLLTPKDPPKGTANLL